MGLKTLSGRFLLLTAAFVMIAEVLIFVPSIARFREDYLRSRLERAEIAALAHLAARGMVAATLQSQLLDSAGVLNVATRRDGMAQLVLSGPVPEPVSATYALDETGTPALMRDALARLLDPEDRVIRVIGALGDSRDRLEVTMWTAPMRAAMIEYGLRILALSVVISLITAALLFVAVRCMMVLPIRRLVQAMQDYAEAPEDSRRIIAPRSRVAEISEAETALHGLQTHLTSALRQKERLAQLGQAVAKISHDLRNILTTAQLFADRMEASEDPAVTRRAPKIVRALSRAVSLCETTLAFGKAEEPAPQLNRIALADIVEDVIENETLAAGETQVDFAAEVPPGYVIRADAEQLHRVLSNLVRNARQAIVSAGGAGRVTLTAGETDDEWLIRVADTGPGLPEKARDHLFQPFQGGIRKGGTGLGLAISADLVRGHGGRLELEQTDDSGTVFLIRLPKGEAGLSTAAE